MSDAQTGGTRKVPNMSNAFNFDNATAIAMFMVRNGGSMSIREAHAEFGMSGGSVTKTISVMRRNGMKIDREWRANPLTGRRYARYYIADESTGYALWKLFDKAIVD